MIKWLVCWLDNEAVQPSDSKQIDWLRVVPFLGAHIAVLPLLYWFGISTTAVVTALILYWVRLFAIGAFYHRYFSHRTFRTNRFWQFIFAVLGASSVQRGPLWWAAHHREHHKVADTPNDVHSPVIHGLWWSHMGWFLSRCHFHYDKTRVQDLRRFPELCWLDRFDTVVPLLLIVILFFLGQCLAVYAPQLQTSGYQLVTWGFFVSTIAVFHSTVTINSLAHQYGRRRYDTNDHSRNNLWLALLTLGEGWHNNHHHCPSTARQGFYWWEIDITYYLLKIMEKLRIIRDVRGLPEHIKSHDQA